MMGNAAAPPGAVLFDLDGTLLDTIEEIAAAMNEVLVELGAEPFPVQRFRDFIGHGARQMAVSAVRAAGLAEDLAETTLRLYLERYSLSCDRSCLPFPGVKEMLDGLQALRIPLGVLSNKPDEFTRRVVEAAFSSSRFLVVRGELPGIPVKPDPTAALAAAGILGIAPERTLFVGDSAVDMETAIRAGMIPVGVSWGFRGCQELLHAGARYLLNNPPELLQIVNFLLPEKTC